MGNLHPHLQFDVPAFFGQMFCIKFLLRSTDTKIQSSPSVTRDFQSIAFLPLQPLIFINLLRRASLFRILLPPFCPFSILVSMSVLWNWDVTIFFVGDMIRHGRDVSVTGEKKSKKNRGDVSRPCLIMHASS